MYLRTITSLLVLLYSIVPLVGQDKIDSSVVFSNRLLRDKGVNVVKIDSLLLKSQPELSLSEFLDNNSSVFIKSLSPGGLATASFRGTAASHTQVQWNGLSLNNPMLGQVDFSLIPLWFTDELILYSGGNSLFHNHGALGGIITINSKPDWTKRITGSLIQGFGSFSNYKSLLDVGGGNSTIQTRFRYMYESAKNDFLYKNIATLPVEYVRQKNADYKKHSFLADFYFRPKQRHELSAHFWGQYADRNLPTIMSFDGLGRVEFQKDYSLRSQIKWKFSKANYSSDLMLAYSVLNLDYFLKNLTYLDDIIVTDSESRTDGLVFKYQFNYYLNKFLFSALLDIDYDSVKIKDKVSSLGYSHSRPYSGLSLRAHYQLRKNLTAYLVLRESLVEDKFSPLMPSFGLDYSPLSSDDLIFKLNMSRNYHYPTLNDQFWLPGGNSNLVPESGYTLDFSSSYKYSSQYFKCNVGASLYYSNIKNWIVWQPSNYYYWTAQNLKNVVAYGGELYFNSTFHLNKLSFQLNANYAHTRSLNQSSLGGADKSLGKQLIYVPVNKGGINGRVEYSNFFFNYRWNYISERFTTSSNEGSRNTLPEFSIHEVILGNRMIKINSLDAEINLRINNLFNLDYQTLLYRPMPKRNYYLTFKINF